MFRAGLKSGTTVAMLVFAVFGTAGAAVRAGKTGVAAHIGAAVVSNQDVNARASADLAKENLEFEAAMRQLKMRHARQLQAAKEAALNRILDERVLALEAVALGTTPQELLKKVPVPQVTPDEIRAFYIAHQADFTAQLSDIAAQIQDQLKEPARAKAHAAYVRSLRQKYQVVVEFEPSREKLLVAGPTRGVADSPVTIVEFADFQCLDCRRFDLVLKKVLDEYRGKVRLEYRHLPQTQLHENAQKAAEAAVCSQNQGKFWEMHDLMLKEQSSLSIEQLKEKAKRIEVDTAAFNECLDHGAAKAAVSADIRTAEQLGVQSAPASFVNGRFVDGAVSESELLSLIEDELLRLERAAKH